MIVPHYGDSFAKHATIAEIEHEIECATRWVQRAEESLKWLRDLHAARTHHTQEN